MVVRRGDFKAGEVATESPSSWVRRQSREGQSQWRAG